MTEFIRCLDCLYFGPNEASEITSDMAMDWLEGGDIDYDTYQDLLCETRFCCNECGSWEVVVTDGPELPD